MRYSPEDSRKKKIAKKAENSRVWKLDKDSELERIQVGRRPGYRKECKNNWDCDNGYTTTASDCETILPGLLKVSTKRHTLS